jgi:hypothetical protein
MDMCVRYMAGVFPRHFTGDELTGTEIPATESKP